MYQHGTSAKKHLYLNTRLIDDEYFADLWSRIEHDGYTENIVVWSCKKRQSWKLAQMKDAWKRDAFFGQLWEDDLYFSPNTFRPSGEYKCDTHEYNLFRVCSWAIDVDFAKNPYYNRHDFIPEQIYGLIKDLIDSYKIPSPNWIEYGHQLRLIFILDEPIGYKTGKSMIRLLKKIQEHLCSIINSEFDLHAERQKISQFYRVPGSINTKSDSRIEVRKITDRKLSLSELAEYLPDHPACSPFRRTVISGTTAVADSDETVGREDLPESHSCRTLISGKRTRIAKLHNQYTLCSDRMAAFRFLRSRPGIPREILLFLYGTTWLTLNSDRRSQLIEELLEFNNGFPYGLQEKEIKSKFRTLKVYDHLTNEYIRTCLGLDYSEVAEHEETACLAMTKRERDRKKKISEGNTRRQRADQNLASVKELYESGMRRNQIAERTGLSPFTVRNMITKINQEKKANAGKHSPDEQQRETDRQ